MKKFKETACDCNVCSAMCHAPCTGTPEEMKKIIDAGYGDRLCLDDWEDEAVDLHPALKGWEGEKAPYSVYSSQGCTFWKDGKCELHDKGLKPLGGRFAHHDLPQEEWRKIEPYLEKAWSNKAAKELIEQWRKDYLRHE